MSAMSANRPLSGNNPRLFSNNPALLKIKAGLLFLKVVKVFKVTLSRPYGRCGYTGRALWVGHSGVEACLLCTSLIVHYPLSIVHFVLSLSIQFLDDGTGQIAGGYLLGRQRKRQAQRVPVAVLVEFAAIEDGVDLPAILSLCAVR